MKIVPQMCQIDSWLTAVLLIEQLSRHLFFLVYKQLISEDGPFLKQNYVKKETNFFREQNTIL